MLTTLISVLVSAATQSVAILPLTALRPPRPGELSPPPGILTLILLAALVGLVVFAAVFPSKRGHQD